MNNQEAAHTQIESLIRRFKSLSAAERRAMNENATLRIDFADPTEKSKHDEIVRLVEEMLEVQKQNQQAEAGEEDARFALQKRIQAVDEEIDARVYRLYGLSPEEINIVEGKG